MTGKDDNHLPYNLENMDIPELEALLQQDFIASDGAAPDVDYTMAVMEVIQKKKQALPNYQPMDAEKAWEEFQSLYIVGEGRTNSVYRSGMEEAEYHVPKMAEQKPEQKRDYSIRKRLIIAALIAALLAVTMIPVSGYANVLQMVIAYWTDDYFSFAPEHRNSAERTHDEGRTIPEGFEDLWNFAAENEIQGLMIPQYISDGFQIADVVFNEYGLTGSFNFCVLYTKDSDYININIIKDGEHPRTIYEKDRDNVAIYQLSNNEYYIFSNNEEKVSALYSGSIEYSFGTTLSEQMLKQIIDSMNYL